MHAGGLVVVVGGVQLFWQIHCGGLVGKGVGGGGTYNSSDNLNALWGIGGSWAFNSSENLNARGGGGGGGGGVAGGRGVTFNSFDNLNVLGGLVGMGGGVLSTFLTT